MSQDSFAEVATNAPKRLHHINTRLQIYLDCLAAVQNRLEAINENAFGPRPSIDKEAIPTVTPIGNVYIIDNTLEMTDVALSDIEKLVSNLEEL